MSFRIMLLRFLVSSLLMDQVLSFGIVDGIHLFQSTTSSLVPQVDVLETYKTTLQHYPLPTEMVTGASLALVGDAIAQTQDTSTVEYDKKRAGAFMCFDMAYRVMQHFAFPAIIASCHGQLLGSLPILSEAVDVHQLATMERTLANQVGIIPFLYYPCFFAMTGVLQGLSVSTTITRAQESFFFLYSRNLLFWIPVQYVQFGFVPENLQIPFVCAAGLVWTTILSVLAGSTKTYDTTPEQDVAVAMEELLTPSTARSTLIGTAANVTALEF